MEKFLCISCKWYFGDLKCAAFIEEIPEEITIGDNDHSEVLNTQENDIVFEPLESLE
jgi:hypothetical protein